MDITIARENPGSADAVVLIDELDAYLFTLYPREACYGLSSEQLIRECVDFFLCRVDGAPAGCGGIKLEGNGYAELKRMYVRPAFRRQGLAALMLMRLEEHAARRGASAIRLETGKYQTEAVAFYEDAGYRRIPPFGSFGMDGYSVFFEKRL